jgi:NAD(P)-dependent dehydrogenase (short-subunit alcohol dehydrogenase family)
VIDRMSLEGRVAAIVGGAGHIGSATAEALAGLGAGIAIVDVDPVRAEEVATAIRRQSGARALVIVADLEDEHSVRKVPQSVYDQLGGLDILVHCASPVLKSDLPGWSAPFEEQGIDGWRTALDVNLTSLFLMSQAAAPLLRRSRAASIVTISSIYGVVGPDWSLYEGTDLASPAGYATSKGGLIQLTRWLATTLAPSIRVNAVSPGGIFRGHTDPFLSRYLARTPLGRMGTEADVVGAVAFLASDLASYITGQNLLVDGGWTAW